SDLDQGAVEPRHLRNSDRFTMKECPSAGGRAELLASDHVDDRTRYWFAALTDRDRHRHLGYPVDEVDGPVEGVDDPNPVRVPTGAARLLPQDRFEIGRASCRERGETPGVAVAL